MASSTKPTIREAALRTVKNNPSQLGDPVSLKAETADSSPTNQDRGASSPDSSSAAKQRIARAAPAPTEGDADGKGQNGEVKSDKTLRQRAMDKLEENPSQLGDPVSLKAETVDSRPMVEDRGAAAGRSKL